MNNANSDNTITRNVWVEQREGDAGIAPRDEFCDPIQQRDTLRNHFTDDIEAFEEEDDSVTKQLGTVTYEHEDGEYVITNITS